jgi:hypothetical protein
MPKLIVAVFKDQEPIVWKCSGCQAAFSHGCLREATVRELYEINRNFAVHCQQKHPQESVIVMALYGTNRATADQQDNHSKAQRR